MQPLKLEETAKALAGDQTPAEALFTNWRIAISPKDYRWSNNSFYEHRYNEFKIAKALKIQPKELFEF